MKKYTLIFFLSISFLSCSDKNEHIILYNQACDYEDIKEFDKSIDLLTQAIKIKPDDIYCYNNRAWDYYETERFQLAKNDFLKIIEIEPNNTAGLYGLGYLALIDSNYVDAIRLFDQIIQIEGPVGRLEIYFEGEEEPLRADIQKVLTYKKEAELKLKTSPNNRSYVKQLLRGQGER